MKHYILDLLGLLWLVAMVIAALYLLPCLVH